VLSSNKKTEIYEDLFRFKNDFNKYARWGYLEQDLIAKSSTWSESSIILMQNLETTKGVIFWVVSKESMQIEDYNLHDIYYDKVLWYRDLSEFELTNINADPTWIYDLTFFPDKLFDGLKIKDFQLQMYNSWDLIDMNLEVLLYYNDSNKGIFLSDINPEDVIDINLIF
jgi:hypothetical protein